MMDEEGQKRIESALSVFRLVRKFFAIWRQNDDKARFVNLCRYKNIILIRRIV